MADDTIRAGLDVPADELRSRIKLAVALMGLYVNDDGLSRTDCLDLLRILVGSRDAT